MSRVYSPDWPPHSDGIRELKEYMFRQFSRLSDHLNTSDPYVYEPWDDLRFPANGLRTPGSYNAPDVEPATGLYLFNGGATSEAVAGVAQMPHAWREGTVIKPHVHWTKTTTSSTGDVYWQLEYQIANPGGTFAGSYTTIGASTVASGTPDSDTAWEHLITPLGEIDMSAYTLSCCIVWVLSRIPTNGADTYGQDARFLEFDIHYKQDAVGSYKEFHKSL